MSLSRQIEKFVEGVVKEAVAITTLMTDQDGVQLSDDEVEVLTTGCYAGVAVLMQVLSEKKALNSPALLKAVIGL